MNGNEHHDDTTEQISRSSDHIDQVFEFDRTRIDGSEHSFTIDNHLKFKTFIRK